MRLRSAWMAVGLTALMAGGVATAAVRPTGEVQWCREQSSAGFRDAFTSRDNLVVGPLVMVGAGRLTPAETVREFGGNKFPVLVAAEHRVTIELTRRARRTASLGYGWTTDGEKTLRDGHRVVTFRSCSRRRAASTGGGRPVTFWSGAVFASGPRCVALRVWVDGERSPRRARIALGRACP